MDDKTQKNDLSNILIVGDSHMQMINILFKKENYGFKFKYIKKINFLTIKGTSISGILKNEVKLI